MIKVRDYIDQIVETCFSPDDKATLEITQNENNITIKDQFLYYYETACYAGTLEALNKAIMYKIFLNQDLLLKIKDYKENISRIVDLGEYSRVTLGYKDQLESETLIGLSNSNSKSTNVQSDQFSGVDQTENLNIDDQRTAVSQTNEVEKLKIMIPQPEIHKGEVQNLDSYSAGETVLIKGQIQYNKSILETPQMNEEEFPIGYQNLTKDLSTTQTNNTNTTSSSRGSESSNINTSKSSNAHTKGSKLDEVNRNVEYITNEARLKIWKTELPKLQQQFWNCFYNLFEYEQY